MRIINLLLVILFILLLLFIIKWKIEAITIDSMQMDGSSYSIADCAKKTHHEIQTFISGEEQKEFEMPIVEEVKPTHVNITIVEGASDEQVADILLKNELMQDKDAFINLVDSMGLLGKFVPGTYEIPIENKIYDTILTLTGRERLEHKITILDGDDASMVGEKLQNAGAIESKDAFAAQCQELGLQNSFVPGEYTVVTPSKVIEIIKQLTGN